MNHPIQITDTFTLLSGWFVLQYPSRMNPDDYTDFADWIALELRKIKRDCVKPIDEILATKPGDGESRG